MHVGFQTTIYKLPQVTRERERERERLQRVIKNRALEGRQRRAEGSRNDEVRERERGEESSSIIPQPLTPWRHINTSVWYDTHSAV